MPKPDTLSRTAQAVLAAAATRNDHLALPPEHLPVAAKRAVVQSLLKAGLLEEVAADDDGAAWRTTEGDERLALRATAAGLTTVGSTTTQESASDSDASVNEQVHTSASEGQQFPEPLSTAIVATVEPTTSRLGLHAAAQAILAAWDDPDRSRPALPGAVEALRAVLTSKAGVRTRHPSGVLRRPRTDTKRAAVLTLLRRSEGATVAQVIEATGWAPHTVRGFFAGLNKTGIHVTVLERVRQVGPGKEGAKGSYTVYRVAEAG